MTTWLTADLHFGHRRIIELAHRPFDSLPEMHECLIESWNSMVGRHDRVFVLGDFGFHGPHADLAAIFDALAGEKHLVIGNHDESNPAVLGLPWASQTWFGRIRDNKRRIFVCHYPMTTWPYAHHGHPHAHGHSHGTLTERRPRRGDVGIDVSWPNRVSGEPLPFDVVYEVLTEERYAPVDHHGGVS